jgi:hypothetical protein
VLQSGLLSQDLLWQVTTKACGTFKMPKQLLAGLGQTACQDQAAAAAQVFRVKAQWHVIAKARDATKMSRKLPAGMPTACHHQADAATQVLKFGPSSKAHQGVRLMPAARRGL